MVGRKCMPLGYRGKARLSNQLRRNQVYTVPPPASLSYSQFALNSEEEEMTLPVAVDSN